MTVWQPKRGKDYGDAEMNTDTPPDVAKLIVDKEYNKSKWPLFLLAIIFVLFAIIVFLVAIESNGVFVINIAKIVSVRGGFAGLLVGLAIYCLYLSQPRVKTTKKIHFFK